jgi:2'-5'-oligoadenylate synthetase
MSTAFSYPVDHHDPRYQLMGDKGSAVHERIQPFLNQKINPKVLRQLGDSLAPTSKEHKNARNVVNKVINALQECPYISVDRCCVSGSFGKGTSVVNFDIDLVVFVNDASPPFEGVIHKLETYMPKVLPAVEIEKTTRFSLQFILDGYEVDLLPAQNLVSAAITPNPSEEQYQTTLEKMKKLPTSDRAYWSGAIAESIVRFMKDQQSFVNAAVRICKLWKKTCRVTSAAFPSWFCSYLIEVMAVDAARQELTKNPSPASLVAVLESFLKGLSSPQTLRVIILDKYEEDDIPVEILRRRPLVLDPANPYNNIVSQVRDWTTIQLLAHDTLDAMSNPQATLRDIFATSRLGNDVPRMLARCNFHLKFILGGSFLRTLSINKIEDLRGERMNPGVDWRKQVDENHCSPVIKNHVISMLEGFANVTTTAIFHHLDVAARNGQGEVQATSDYFDQILHHAFDKPQSDWVPTSKRDEDCDCSLTFGQIPLPSQPNDLRYIYLKLSFDVDDARFYRLAYEFQKKIDRKNEEMY